MLTGCADLTTEIPDADSILSESNKIDEASNHNNKQTAEDIQETPNHGEVVTLLIYGEWNDENRTTEYTLSDEYSQIIVDLFYNHERELLDSPVSSVGSLQFQIGEDFLTTSMSSLGTLSGRISGELVAIELSEGEYETVHQIISTYTQDTK